MRRLSGRLRRLEESLANCPACAKDPRRVELVYAGEDFPAEQAGERCRVCGCERETLFVHLSSGRDATTDSQRTDPGRRTSRGRDRVAAERERERLHPELVYASEM